MQAFLAPSLYDARRIPQTEQGSQLLRTKHHAGAKGTPNTP
jgi:hypothetical protein